MNVSQLSWYASSASAEWYTEAHVILRVVKALGWIDLDPCSNPAPYNVPATRHLTREDNGLLVRWEAATLYMNPPYGRRIGQWIDKLAHEVHEGRVREAICLTPASTDARWFRTLWESDALCFWYGRLNFRKGVAGHPGFGSTHASVFSYFGPNEGQFHAAFADAGKVVFP